MRPCPRWSLPSRLAGGKACPRGDRDFPRHDLAVACSTGAFSAAARLGGLQGKQALVIGLGEVGESAARAFASVPGALPVIVANRTRARAEQVAEAVGGRVATWAELPTVLGAADVVASCTSGEGAVLGEASARAAVASRAERPMLLIDLAVPRDIDPGVANVPGVTLLNMDDISGFVAAKVDGRRAEVPAVERIIAEEVDRYSTALAARAVAPLVGTLYDRAEEIRAAEMARLELRHPRISALQTANYWRPMRPGASSAKLLHEPTVNLEVRCVGTARGEALADAFRELFGLELYCAAAAERREVASPALLAGGTRGLTAAHPPPLAGGRARPGSPTTGDRRSDVPVWEMGGRGVFVRESPPALLSGQADAAVHSAKDLQPVPAPGIRLAAVPPRRPEGRARRQHAFRAQIEAHWSRPGASAVVRNWRGCDRT